VNKKELVIFMNLNNWIENSVNEEIKKWETLKRTHLSSINTINAKLRDLYAQKTKSI